jgi:hypothetical protein
LLPVSSGKIIAPVRTNAAKIENALRSVRIIEESLALNGEISEKTIDSVPDKRGEKKTARIAVVAAVKVSSSGRTAKWDPVRMLTNEAVLIDFLRTRNNAVTENIRRASIPVRIISFVSFPLKMPDAESRRKTAAVKTGCAPEAKTSTVIIAVAAA